MNNGLRRWTVCGGVLFLIACGDEVAPVIGYTPPVLFAGYINGDYIMLEGNRIWPNRCSLVGDTVRIYLYSKGFSEENRIRKGDLVRLDIFPGTDSLIGTGKVLFHMARYHERNTSYTINAADSSDNAKSVAIRALSLGRYRGGAVDLDNMMVRTGPVGGTPGEMLLISDASIRGGLE